MDRPFFVQGFPFRSTRWSAWSSKTLGDSAFGLEGPIELPVNGWLGARLVDLNGNGAMDFVGKRYTAVDIVFATP